MYLGAGRAIEKYIKNKIITLTSKVFPACLKVVLSHKAATMSESKLTQVQCKEGWVFRENGVKNIVHLDLNF